VIVAVAIGVVRAALRALPDETRAKLVNVKIMVSELPDAKDIARGAQPGQRGYFWGTCPEPITTTEIPDDTLPDGELVIFAGVHTSIEEIERTLAHELAHAIGHSEEEICEVMGLGA
jgi:predicted Zn-dependent protease with MMP-like domain